MTSRDKSSRHHRTKRLLVYRPSPVDCIKTPPQHHEDPRPAVPSPRCVPSPLQLASPMERERRRILSVELRDIVSIKSQVEQLQVKTPPCERSSGAEDRVLHRLSSGNLCKDLVITPSSTVLPVSTRGSSHTLPAGQPAVLQPPLSPPKEVPGWGLVPLFNSVRSKLESFAEIFLTPIKSRRDAQDSEDGAHLCEPSQQEVSRGPAQSSTVDPGDRVPHDPSSALLHGDGTTEDNPSPPQLQKAPLKLQIETCRSASILCRPPLQRCLSCPVLPLAPHKQRHSLDMMERTTEPCTCRRRRHSLGAVEECRDLSVIPFSLSCLRKENHPCVLRPSSYPPGDWRRPLCGSVHNEGSPAGLCLDREQGLSGVEVQVTRESPPDFKNPENLSCSKESKVSTIQIRKRALKQEGKLTPLGLPKRVRLQKEDFSLEEIYTNKNYHTPTEKRKFETIFEEPIMKGGTLLLTSQRPLRRIMIFKDGGCAPRKRKKKGKGGGRTRRRTAAGGTEENVNYELLLQHKLNQLEAALQEDLSDQ
ncbi:proline-rich protein 14 isoform X2 [Rhinoderma darwinii]|uniref:proline-rich protein 14 isoform X2 n=1 Tax=Rhinoderma darwinii TaxID=43563 RepID=UPI003F6683A7